MAKKNEVTTNSDGHIEIDISHLLPEGYAKDELVTVGGLRPIVGAELSFERRSAIVGHLVALLDMPPRPSLQNPNEKEPWQALLVRLSATAWAMVGADAVEVPAGKDVLVPLNGNLRQNHDLIGAAADQVNVWVGGLYVTGQVDLGVKGRNPMWNYSVQIHKKPIPRTGAFALFNRPTRALPPGITSDGTVYDVQTGEIRSAIQARA
jgi:hypothetical protein